MSAHSIVLGLFLGIIFCAIALIVSIIWDAIRAKKEWKEWDKDDDLR